MSQYIYIYIYLFIYLFTGRRDRENKRKETLPENNENGYISESMEGSNV
jgi:hypothetical protein